MQQPPVHAAYPTRGAAYPTRGAANPSGPAARAKQATRFAVEASCTSPKSAFSVST